MFGWLLGAGEKPPVFLKIRSSKTYIIITVSSAIFTDIFVYGIVVPVLPFALTSRANVAPGQIQTWISIFLAVYGAALLLAAPFCGWLADRTTSRRWPLVWGLVALGGATAMLCVGSSIGVLAAARVLQGIAAAVVWTVGLALLVDTVGPDEIGQAMGYVGISMSLAILLAPLLGGVVFAASGYYAVFAMAFALVVVDVFLRLTMVEKKVAKKWLPDIRLPGEQPVGTKPKETKSEVIESEADAAVPGTKSVEMDTLPSPHDADGPGLTGVESPRPNLARHQSVSSAAHAAAESLPESVPTPFKRLMSNLPPIVFLLASRRVLSAIWACLIQASLMTAFDSVLPLFVRDTFHWNSTGAGLIFLPIVVTSFAGPLIGYLSDKHGPRYYATAGFVLACPALILLRLVKTDTLDQKVLLCALLALIGANLTLVLTPMMAEVAYAVDAKAQRRPPGYFGRNGAYAQAYSLFNMAWAGGCLVGPLLAGMINQTKGWGTTTLILGLVSAVTAVPTLIWTGGSIFKKRRAARLEQQQRQPEVQSEDDAGGPGEVQPVSTV